MLGEWSKSGGLLYERAVQPCEHAAQLYEHVVQPYVRAFLFD